MKNEKEAFEIKDEQLEQVTGGGALRNDRIILLSKKTEDAKVMQANIVDMAVGVIVGGAFGKTVSEIEDEEGQIAEALPEIR